jgi:hypothetical protein
VLCPGFTVREVGLMESVKLPVAGGWTTNVAVDVRVKAGLVLVPVTVKTYEPAGVVLLVVIERADVAPVFGLGVNVPAAPAGRPLIDRDTVPANPPVLVTFSV